MDWLKLVDLLAVKVGDKVKIKNNIPSANGMLYKDTKVKIDQFLDGGGELFIPNFVTPPDGSPIGSNINNWYNCGY